MFHRNALLPLTFALALSCSSATGPSVTGDWGGQGASLSLTAAGGTVNYSCGNGTIDPGWTLDRDGRFAATGMHSFGGGPVPPGGNHPYPATYAGQVRGDTLTFSVTITDLQQTLGPFLLLRNGPVAVQQCV
ncbi:MAG TPA: hypothetical protein VNH46_12020 [Gemmatimonadales bacterium]|nr:hypothetical protein [Gemmatimonadales bacterium]